MPTAAIPSTRSFSFARCPHCRTYYSIARSWARAYMLVQDSSTKQKG